MNSQFIPVTLTNAVVTLTSNPHGIIDGITIIGMHGKKHVIYNYFRKIYGSRARTLYGTLNAAAEKDALTINGQYWNEAYTN